MNNIKELHPKEGVTLLAVKVPGGAYDFTLNYLNTGLLYQDDESEAPFAPLIRLPFECKLLGIATEIPEEVWQGIMHEPEIISEVDNGHDIKEIYGYSDFTDEDSSFNTASESGMSLLEANEVYSVNPFKKPIEDDYMPVENFTRKQQDSFWEAHREWQQAESNTGTWVILQKL